MGREGYDSTSGKGTPTWSTLLSTADVFQAETYEIEIGKATHGSSGPLKVSHGGISLPIGKEFIDIGSKLEKDRPVSDEGNGFVKESINVFYVSFLYSGKLSFVYSLPSLCPSIL